MNLGYVFESGNAVLVATFLLLIGMSVVSWYVIFWKCLKIRAERAHVAAFKTHYLTHQYWPKHGDIKEAEGVLRMLIDQADKTTVVAGNYEKQERKELYCMHLAQTLDAIRAWLDRGLTLLASVGSSAPFIGLFGTVWGIYGALARIAAEGNASLNVVAGPMGEALVATAVGLFAAIPAVLAYNAFVRANRLLVQDLRHIAEQLSTYLSLDASGRKGKAADAVRLVAGK